MPDFFYEQEAVKEFGPFISGIDEAGRGPLVGAVTASAVILPEGFSDSVLNDSKKLSEKKRDVLYEKLTNHSEIFWAVVSVDAAKIDEINILKATHLAMELAAVELKKQTNVSGFLIDGSPVKTFPFPNQNIVKGDSKSLSISAASIVAKVTRDQEMYALDKKYPEYGFAQHKGYGTKAHIEAIKKHGICPEHRRSFSPCRDLS